MAMLTAVKLSFFTHFQIKENSSCSSSFTLVKTDFILQWWKQIYLKIIKNYMHFIYFRSYPILLTPSPRYIIFLSEFPKCFRLINFAPHPLPALHPIKSVVQWSWVIFLFELIYILSILYRLMHHFVFICRFFFF